MADPPPKKVGSLRDRIAAFENKSTSSTPTSPPAPRAKPAGHVSWKPRPASPSPADEPAQSEKKPSAGVGMSAADAKAAIGAGGSLKERMAALQGHGGFGGAAPPAAPPKPAGEKPKWKPPPQVASPPPDESQPRTSTEDRVVSEENEPKTGHEAEEAGEERPKDEADEKGGEARELDPEEAERQRRAALAARMARLGGARVGMGPPIFGQKPDVPKKPSAPKDEEPRAKAPEKDTPLSPPIDKLHDTQTSPAVPADVRSPAASSEQEYFAQENKSPTSLLSADSTPTSQPRSPAMPVPAAPRRAAPPRRKAPKSPTPPGAVIADAPVTESPAAGTPQLTSDDSSKELQEAIHKSKEDEVLLGLSPVTQPLQSAHDPPHAEPAEHAEEFANPAEVEEHAEETSPEETRVVQDSLDQLALDNESKHVQAELPDAHSTHEEPIVEERSPDFEPQQPSAKPEEEEDEAERRMRIAERLKQQGGFNPFGASPSPPVRTSSEQEPPSRKASVDVHREETAPEPEQVVSEPEIVNNVMRRQSTDYNARSLDSPKSPPLPPASTRPDGRTKRDSDMSNLSVHKVGEAEDNDESVDDSSNIPIYNDHPLDEHDEEARVADIHSESEDYVDAPEEQDQTPKFAHEESVPALTDTELELQAVVPPRKRVSVPPPSRSVPARPSVAQDEDVYDEFEEVPPTPPRRTSIPPPPRAAPPPAVEHVEEVNEGCEQIHPPPPKQTLVLPPPRALPPSPPEVQEAEQPEQPPPSPPRRASVPPPHANVILPPHPVTCNEDEEDEDLSREPKFVSTVSYEDPQDETDAPPPPPRRISIPPPSRYAPPSSPPSHGEAQDHEHEHGSLPPSPVHPRRSIPPPPPVLEYDDEPTHDDKAPTVHDAGSSQHESSEFTYVDEPEDAAIEPIAPPPLTEAEEAVERRQRIAERLRQQGGFNPFGAPPPPPVRKATRPSHGEVPVPDRRDSADLPRSPPPPVRRSTRPPEPERRASVENTQSPTSPVLMGQPVEVAHTSPVQLEPVKAEEEEGSAYFAKGNHDAEDVPPPPPPRRESLPTLPPQGALRSPSLELPKRGDLEILSEEDGDPIDPSFYRLSRSPSSATLPAGYPSQDHVSQQPEPEQAAEPQHEPEPTVEDDEVARKRTIAERMAKLGGIRFGAPPPIMRPPPPPVPVADEHGLDESTAAAGGDQETQPVENEEEDEFARKQRIAARLASQGGMRFGMFPTPVAPSPAPTPKSPPPPSHAEPEESELAPPPLPPSRPPPRAAPPLPVPQMLAEQSDADSEGYSQVDAEESEIEEVYHSDEEAPPPVPARPVHRGSAVPDGYTSPHTPSFRPPVPTARPPIPPPNRPTMSTSTTHNDFVMVEVPESSEEIPPPPPPRTVSLKKGLPAPPLQAPPAAEAASQWDNALDFGGETDLSLSGQWSEDSTQYPAHQSQLPGSSDPVPPPVPAKLTGDELMAQWGRVGVQIHEIATTLYERSKRSLIGDGTFVGFVSTVLNEVPNASKPVPPYTSFGYLIYEQVGSSVHVRANEIMPGDIITLHDAKLKGHKGIQIYHQNVGINEPVCAIIGDYENKKSKVKVFQANQRVGQESVESVSYRLEDLKSGTVKIFRVLEV